MHFSLLITLIILPVSAPVPIISTPVTLSPPPTADIDAIARPLHLFSHAIDTQNFPLLASVFTTDAICDFRDDKGVLRGLSNISAQLERGLEGVVTHHALSTLLVEFEDCGGTGKGANKGEMGVGMKARAESYLQGTFFFGGGRAVVTLGRYLDEVRLTDVGWRVTNKTLIRTSLAIKKPKSLPIKNQELPFVPIDDMPSLRFLCLHGSGTSAEIMRAQLRPLVRELERDNTASFYFVDGELESATPGPGIGNTYESPYYSYHNWPRSLDPADDRSLNDAYDFLYDVIDEEGPFDAILGFSQGATLAYGFLAQHARNHPYESPTSLFRCAIFFGALPPFRTKGKDGAAAEQIIYDEDLQGAVRIPTLHVAGKSDFVYPHSVKLHQLCNASWAGLVVHPKGHEIPKDPKNVALIADGIREASHHAMFT